MEKILGVRIGKRSLNPPVCQCNNENLLINYEAFLLKHLIQWNSSNTLFLIVNIFGTTDDFDKTDFCKTHSFDLFFHDRLQKFQNILQLKVRS